jgi:hypothetical protein
MKTLSRFLLAALVSGAPFCGAKEASDDFNPIGIDYKKPQDLPDSFFNPFKVQSAGESQKKDSATVTDDAIVEALGHRGISGIIYALREGRNRVIIGDQVFGVGDELTFPNDAKDVPDPLIAGASVVLREVGKANLTLEVTPESEPVRRLTFPLRAFWRP